ncbi:MAG: DinB family protein [Pseudomonadota bacterium]
MGLLAHLRTQARASRLANRRLHAAMQGLPAADFHAPHTGFFPSLAATLNHILAVDGYYLAALRGEPNMERRWSDFVPASDVAALAARQAAMDEALIAHCEALDDAALAAAVAMERGEHVDRAPASQVLAHLFMHQTHHRGQAHAMLSGTAVAPPQLDEFLLASDARLRTADLQALGWTEATLFGPATG